MSRVVSSHCRRDNLLSTQLGGEGAPTCYGGRAGRLHGVTLLGEGLNAGETRQTRGRGMLCTVSASRPHLTY